MIPGGDLPPRPRDRWTEVFEANGYSPALNDCDRELAAVTAERDALAVWFDVTLDYLAAMLHDVAPDESRPTSPTGGDVR